MESQAMPIDANTIHDRTPPLGLRPQLIDFPEGTALVQESRSFTIMTGSDGDTTFIGVVAVIEYNGLHLGSISPLMPDRARAIAASIITAANLIDGGPRA